MKIGFVGAHMDDIEFGCAGTMLKAKDGGDAVFSLVMTDGTLGGDGNVRLEEQRAASSWLGSEIRFGEFKDGKMQCDPETISRIRAWLEETGVSVVFTHTDKDTHQDHRNVSLAVSAATAHKRISVVHFGAFSSQEYAPNLFVDITEKAEEKKLVLGTFKTQIAKYEKAGINFIGEADARDRFFGTIARTGRAEGFHIVKSFA